jgi:hypothetical protein
VTLSELFQRRRFIVESPERILRRLQPGVKELLLARDLR